MSISQNTMNVGLTITGVDDLLRRLGKLDESVRKSLLRRGVGAAMKPVTRAAKANLVEHKRTGQLIKSVGQVVKVYRRGTIAVGVVGPRHGFSVQSSGGGKVRNVEPTNYSHLIEYGVKPHRLGKGVLAERIRVDKQGRVRRYRASQKQTGAEHPGLKAVRFLHRAVAAQRAAAIEAFRQTLEAGLQVMGR